MLIAVAFTTTIFVSASLLFFVQPMYAKLVLPLLGGAPAVWTTAMLFFQSVLLAGYAYSHAVSTRLPARRQLAPHLVVWACGLAFLPIGVPAGWTYDVTASPIGQTLMVFAMGVGWPFFALAANAPLLQKWYASSGGPAAGDPYHLYAASNAGSLIALLGYPLLAEPLLGTQAISRSWAVGYMVLGVGLVVCGLLAAREAAPHPDAPKAAAYRLMLPDFVRWVGLAFVPSSMMLGVTSTISNDIGAFPLVWVLPLALYLLTFVIAFAERVRPPQRLVAAAFLVTVIAAVVPMATSMLPGLGWIGFAVLFAAFFSVALLCHMRLYETRPPVAGLTPFYFAMATGGALGGLFNSVIAPVAFDGTTETLIVFALAGLALAGRWRPLRDTIGAAASVAVAVGTATLIALAFSLAPDDDFIVFAASTAGALLLLAARTAPLRFALTTAGLLIVGNWLYGNQGVIHKARSFFGVYTVRDDAATGLRTLGHGTTQHGLEFIADLDTRPRILSYYHPNGPLGQIFRSGAVGPDARVGIVGLGVGALACYARAGQQWRFYEIDGLIDEIARTPSLFSYLAHCAGEAPTVLGDARVTLAREADARFDLLVIDAYSSDAIPVHLITIEAIELYLSRLAPGGLLAFHISNRYYRLAPVLGDAARALGVDGYEQFHAATADRPLELGESEAHVVILSRDPGSLSRFAGDPRWHRLVPAGKTVWTDDHANLLGALKAFE